MSYLLKAIWFLQWLFALVLLLFFLAISTNYKGVDLEKLNGFHISFAQVQMGNVLINKETNHQVVLTNGEGRIHISNYKQQIVLFKILGAFIDLLVSMYVIFILRIIFRNLKEGDFFVRANGIYLRKIAYAVVSISVFLSVYKFLISNYIYHNLSVENIVMKRSIEFDTRTILFGLMIFVFAKIFIKGTEIKEEQDLTI